MSIYDDDELGNYNIVRFETQVGTSKVRFRTPKGPGCKVTIDLGEGRPREWDERKGPGMTGAFIVPKGAGLVKGTITIEYFAEAGPERERLRFEHNDFLEMTGSPKQGDMEKRFVINHPECMLITPPMTECVFQNDPVTKHDEITGKDTVVFKIMESRKQAPALTSTTAPGAATREGQAQDKYDAELAKRTSEYDANMAEIAQLNGAPTP